MATAGNGDLNIALRVQTDMQQARAELQRLQAQLDSLGKGTPAVDAKPIEAVGQAARQTAADTQALAQAIHSSSQATVAAVDRAAASMGKFGQQAHKSSNDGAKAVDRNAQSIIANIQRQLAAMEAGGSGTEKYYRALQRIRTENAGLPAWLQRLAAAEAGHANQLAKNGLSAKQYAAALRGLPAQMTDITVGLSTGQSPWMVLMQQGGQLKDMFGGAVPAIKAVGGSVAGLVNPFTLAIAAVAGLGAAWLAGRRESEGYATALTMTGNAAGATVGQLTLAARQAGQLTGSYGKASEAVTLLASSGKVSNAVIAQATTATVAMAQTTGASLDSMVQHFEALGKSPVEASRKLNEQYNYLTAAVYEQIKALQAQGRADEAAAMAQRTFASAMTDRANEVKTQLNALGRAASWVGEKFSGMWHSVANIGRVTPLDDKITEAREEYMALVRAANNSAKIAGWFGLNIDTTKDARREAFAELQRLQAQRDKEQANARAQEQRAQDNAAAVAAIDAVTAANKTAMTQQQKLNAALADYRKNLDDIRKTNPNSPLLDPATIAQTEAAYREQFKDRKPAAPKTSPTESAFTQQYAALTQRLAQLQNELANAQDGVASSTGRATVQLAAWLQTNAKAQGMDARRIAQLQALAEQVDTQATQLQAAQDLAGARQRAADGLQGIQAQWLAATGRAAEATALQIEQRFAKLRADLQATGNAEGLAQVDVVIRTEQAKAQLQALSEKAQRIFADQGRAEQSIANQVTAGLTSELQAKQKILDLNTATAAQVEALLPRMRELAALTGDPALAAGIADLEGRIGTLKVQANELKDTFTDAFANGFASALSKMAEGTASLQEVVLGFIHDLAMAMANWAAQGLAQHATSALMGMMGAGAPAGADAAGAATSAAITAASAAGAATMGAGVTTGAATGATAMATAITTAGAMAAQAMGAAIAAAGASGQGGSLLSGAASLFGGSGFASGGYTGPGGKFQPAGIVHAGEFVNRQEVVRQPGALAFLSDFNRVGMAALQGWQGYADGGLVVPGTHSGVPTSANFQPATVNVGGSTVDNRLQLNLIDDPDRIASMAFGSRQGQEAFTVMLSRNPAKFRQLLGVGN